ncbi:hypothetical protein MLD38_037752 [Melastoma candidum]|uniref:Uncharacterized protein n=1 Tax=Melastoma candidum TaxID=119954 RepID=A0ACB9LPL0_9MYRT|nr:hypothetical protein MLD38_037752 [Melastoma candidum]
MNRLLSGPGGGLGLTVLNGELDGDVEPLPIPSCLLGDAPHSPCCLVGGAVNRILEDLVAKDFVEAEKRNFRWRPQRRTRMRIWSSRTVVFFRGK